MHLGVVPAGMQAIEIGHAVHAQKHGLAVDHKPIRLGSATPIPRSAENARSNRGRFR